MKHLTGLGRHSLLAELSTPALALFLGGPFNLRYRGAQIPRLDSAVVGVSKSGPFRGPPVHNGRGGQASSVSAARVLLVGSHSNIGTVRSIQLRRIL